MQPDRSIGAHVKTRELSGEVRAAPTKASLQSKWLPAAGSPPLRPSKTISPFLSSTFCRRLPRFQRLSFLRGQVDEKPSRTVAAAAGSVRSHLYELPTTRTSASEPGPKRRRKGAHLR